MSEKDIVAEAREVAGNMIAGRPRILLRVLADEVERLRKPNPRCVRCGKPFERLCGNCSNQPSSVF